MKTEIKSELNLLLLLYFFFIIYILFGIIEINNFY